MRSASKHQSLNSVTIWPGMMFSYRPPSSPLESEVYSLASSPKLSAVLSPASYSVRTSSAFVRASSIAVSSVVSLTEKRMWRTFGS